MAVGIILGVKIPGWGASKMLEMVVVANGIEMTRNAQMSAWLLQTVINHIQQGIRNVYIVENYQTTL